MMRVGIPITLMATVYIDADVEMPAGVTTTVVDGVEVVSMDEDSPEDWAAVAGALEASAKECQDVADVRHLLRDAAEMIVYHYPGVDVRFTPLAGIVPEMRISPDTEPT